MPAQFSHVVEIAAALPGVEESTSYGTPALKVKGKMFARSWEDGVTLVLRTTFEDREFLLRTDPAVFFVTDHYRDHPYVLVRLPKVRRPQLRQLLHHAWTLMAPKTLLRAAAPTRAR